MRFLIFFWFVAANFAAVRPGTGSRRFYSALPYPFDRARLRIVCVFGIGAKIANNMCYNTCVPLNNKSHKSEHASNEGE